MEKISAKNFCRFLKENNMIWDGMFYSKVATIHYVDLQLYNLSLNNNKNEIAKIHIRNSKCLSDLFDLTLSDKSFILTKDEKKIDLSRKWRVFLKKLEKNNSTELTK
ncbi:MAG: hypothetical protein IJW25_00420 [Clostridia bacterium]|nr:hypothetical protein [Clostridia bacterium]